MNSGKIWLVKSSTRILGPFSIEEITELVRSKRISIIDEVRNTDGRWNYIREASQFKSLVEEIRAEQSQSSEETMTHSIAQQTSSKTDALSDNSITQNLANQNLTNQNLNDELTPTPQSLRGGEHSQFKDVTPSANRPSLDNSEGSTKSYGSLEDSQLRSRIDKRSQQSKLIISMLTILCVLAAFFILNNKKQQKSLGYEELIQRAVRYKSIGLFDESIVAYKKAIVIREPELGTKALMAPLYISVDKQTLAGRRVLETFLLKDNLSRSEITDANLAIAVSYMIDGDLNSAERVLQKVMANDPNNRLILTNLAVINLKRGAYGKAYNIFDSIYQRYPDFRLAFYGKALSGVELARSRNSIETLAIIGNQIVSEISRSSYLRSELLVLLASINTSFGDINNLQKTMNRFLSDVPFQTPEYATNLFVDMSFIGWERLEKFCDEVFTKNIFFSELKAFQGTCLSRAGKDKKGLQLLQEALAETPKNPFVLLTQADMLISSGRSTEALAILKMPEVSALPTKDILLGNLCLHINDIVCARKAFSSAYQQDRNNLATVYGLAWVYSNSENGAARAYDTLRGLPADTLYLPIIKLRDSLESQ